MEFWRWIMGGNGEEGFGGVFGKGVGNWIFYLKILWDFLFYCI
jgi:hypothetical protein